MCTVWLAPAARSPIVQVRTPAEIEQVAAAVPPFTVQLVPGLVGNVSFKTTPCARPVPVFVTVSVKPMLLPAPTVPASGVLWIVICAGWQTILASLVPPLSLVEVAVAVLSYTVHSLADVIAVICTLKLAPAARSVGPQLSIWLGLEPVTEHRPALDWVSIAQVTPVPEPAGNGSETATPCPSPAPVFVTVTVNPIGSPALTGV